MEKMIDFDEWLANYIPEPTKYVAVFDPETGAVKSVGPDHAFTTEKNKISLDTETAESIINSEIMIHKCFVDIDSSSLEIADVYLAYSSKNKTLKIQLSAELGGTKKVKGDIKKRKIVWDGDTEMNFLITEYNDPNLIFEMFSVKINELVGKTKTLKDIDYENFSVYTRRLFKNYVIEYK